MLNTLKALADTSRLRLVAVLSHGEFTVQELTSILVMGQSRISRHLKILTRIGILSVKRQGTWGYYRLAGSNSFFREIWPGLERRLDTLAGRQADLDGLARIFEARRRKSQEFFDYCAPQWDVLARKILPVAEYLDFLIEEIPACDVVLEVGVGTGSLLAGLSRKASRMVAVDHSPAMIEEARARIGLQGLTGVELRLGEMSHLPLSNGEAQFAVLNMVLHHAAQPAGVLKEMFRVLRPSGGLVIADLQRHEKEWVRDRMADLWLGFERREIEGWLQAAGFVINRFRTVEGAAGEQEVFILTAGKGGQAAEVT
jgi:ubiquinone/menaquinone biosynthesis C-methylase UbiE